MNEIRQSRRWIIRVYIPVPGMPRDPDRKWVQEAMHNGEAPYLCGDIINAHLYYCKRRAKETVDYLDKVKCIKAIVVPVLVRMDWSSYELPE